MITLFSIQTALRTPPSLEMKFLFRASFLPEPFRMCLLCQKMWGPACTKSCKSLELELGFIPQFPTACLLPRAQGRSETSFYPPSLLPGAHPLDHTHRGNTVLK